jgi:hypothetical protein
MLSDTLSRLASDFASQVFAALRSASLDELTELAGRSVVEKSPAAPKRQATLKKRVERRTAVKTIAAAPKAALDGKLTSAALEFFAERGSKGATAAQLSEHLQSADGAEVVSNLASNGFIRDAGIRRATGKGTAAVYVLSA